MSRFAFLWLSINFPNSAFDLFVKVYQPELRKHYHREECQANPRESLDKRKRPARILARIKPQIDYARKASNQRAQARTVQAVKQSTQIC